MGLALGFGDDLDGAARWRLVRWSKSAPQIRPLLALAQIYDGGNRSDAARIGGVTLQIARDRLIRLDARGPDDCWTARPQASARSLVMPSAGRLPRWSSAGRSRRFIAWCGGG